MALESSELITNADGSIYHLALKPEQVADTVLTVGDPGRVPRVSRHFDHIESEVEKREFRSCTGTLAGQRMTVLSTGIGTDNIDIALNELDALCNIDLESRQIKQPLRSLRIIRLGTSGSLQADIPVDALVLSSHGLGLDGLLDYYQDPEHRLQWSGENPEHSPQNNQLIPWPQDLNQFPIRPYLIAGSSKLQELFPPSIARGITATCPGFYGPQGRNLRLQSILPDLPHRLSQLRFGEHRVTNFEMETAAIYGLGALLGHQCASVNVILANRINGTFSKNPSAAVDYLIRSVLEILTAQQG